MLFVTFQSKEVVDELREKGEYIQTRYRPLANCCGRGNEDIRERVGYKPIFVYPFTDKRDFLARILMSHPSLPQRMIVFKSNNFDTVGCADWLKLMKLRKDLLADKVSSGETLLYCDDLPINNKAIFNEYVVPKIELSKVKGIYDITDSEVSTRITGEEVTCSDEMCDFIYSGKMEKIFKKYFPKDSCKAVDIGNADMIASQTMLKYLSIMYDKPELLSESLLYEIYNFARSNFAR